MAIVKTFQEPIRADDKYLQDFFADALRQRGVEVQELGVEDYKSMLRGPKTLAEIVNGLISSELVVHNTRSLIWSMLGIDVRASDNDEEFESVRKFGLNIDRNLNYTLYAAQPSKCFQVYPPNGMNIVRKDVMVRVLPELGVPVPRTVPKERFEMDFFPVYVKKVNGSCSRDIEFIATPEEFEALFPSKPKDYVVQEAYIPPTSFASNIRFMCYGPKIIGGIIYYNPNHPTKLMGAEGTGGVPLSEERPLTNEQRAVRDAYSLDGQVDKIVEYVATIGQYAQSHGFPALSVEIAMDRYTGKLGIIDVNVYFAMKPFRILFCRENTPDIEVKKLAGEKFADAYLSLNS